MSSSNPRPTFERSTAGLRDALFSEMEDLKSGASAPHEALAFSKLASQIISSVELDLRYAELEARKEDRMLHEKEQIRAHELALLAAPELDQQENPDDCNIVEDVGVVL